VTAFGVAVDSAGLLAPPGLTLPLPFVALDGVGAAAPRVLRPDPAGCGPEAGTAHILREALLALPGRLEANTTWRDSATYPICRDSVLLTAISTRTFRIVRATRRSGALVVEVERRSALTLRGDGRQFGEPISIEARGDGVATLFVQLAGSVVVDGTGESTLTMTMRGRRRSQELTQHTRIMISSP
jgi:hypothetical protein